MRGSRSATRPQRQARSGVTYKESDDDDDDEFLPSTGVASDRRSIQEPGVAKGKRTLTLKRARTTLEPPVSLAKEDVDVYTLPGGAIEEKSVQFPQFYEAAERVLNSHRRQSSAFECLLEAVSDASGDGEEEGGQKTTGHSGRKVEVEFNLQEEMTSAAYGPELLAAYSAFERKLQAVKGVKEEDAAKKLAHSTDEETRLTQGTKDKKGQEDEKSSGDEKKYVRRGEKVKLDNIPSADAKKDVESYIDDKKVSETGEEDKPYNMSSTDDEENADADDSWNESSDASDAENKQEKSVTVPAPASKRNQDVKTSVKNVNLAQSDPGAAERVPMPAKSTSAPPLLPKKRPALWGGTKPFVPPGPKTLQTPTAHRRVVGLSRRHRPPPLHPYLLGS